MTPRPGSGAGRESATWLRLGRHYRAPLLLRQFPAEVPFGFLSKVLPTTEPVELTDDPRRRPWGIGDQHYDSAIGAVSHEGVAGVGMGRNPIMDDTPYVAEHDVIALRNRGKAIEKSERHGHRISDFNGRIPNEKSVRDRTPCRGADVTALASVRYQSDITI